MLISVLFLLLGTLSAEVSLFGIRTASLAGAVLFGLSAVSFVVVGVRRHGRSATVGSLSRSDRPATTTRHRTGFA